MNTKRWQDLEFYSENGAPKICITEKNQKDALNSLGSLSEELYADCLIELEKIFTTEEEKVFYQAFAHAYLEIFIKKKKNKRNYWNLKSLVLPLIGAGGGGTILLTSFFTLLNTVITNLVALTPNSEGAIAWCMALAKNYFFPCLLFLIGWMVVRFSLDCFRQEVDRHNYQETWVRHSITYHQINMVMVQFLSGMISEKSEFMEKVLEILGGNVTRFQHNMQRATGGKDASASRSGTSAAADTGMGTD